jgi:hypothetical protein
MHSDKASMAAASCMANCGGEQGQATVVAARGAADENKHDSPDDSRGHIWRQAVRARFII